MSRIRQYIILFSLFSILLLNVRVSVEAYNEYEGIEYDDIVDVGFVSKGKIIWCNRKPH